jgi:hypothetical protein
MEPFFEYAVLRATPDALRGETLNIGLVVFHPQSIDVRLAPSLRKLLTVDSTVDLNDILELPESLKQWATRFDSVEQKFEAIRNYGIVSLSARGRFVVTPSVTYDDHVTRLMLTLVVPKQREGVTAAPTNRITTRLKEMFEKQEILGRNIDDLKRHLVVPNFPIDRNENLYAEFALKNGSLWVTETTDFRAKTKGPLDNSRVAAFAAIKLHKAKKRFRGAKAFVVYAASGESEVSSQLNLLRDYADMIVNIRSKGQMADYMQQMLSAAGTTKQLTQ